MTETSTYVVQMRAEIAEFSKKMNDALKVMQSVEKEGDKLSKSFSSSFSKSTSSTKSFTATFQRESQKVKSSTSGITSVLKSFGAAVIAAFSVRQIVKFGSECVNAASKLNAMKAMSNKAFGSMSEDVQNWAKSASKQFGLSQRMALQYTSTLGSMAQGFGFSQAQAVQLSETIAGRIGDLASYYSITQDEAYSKMTAIFSGETEALKSLGIVMTQTALDEFALANGFGKTTKSMSEQEKVMLRYKFLMNQTKLAEGDFMESSARGSWGNQIRQLKLQIEDFKSSFGQGLIVVLTPALKLLNQLMSKIVAVSQAFADLMSKLSGSNKKSVSAATPAIAEMGETIAEAGEAAEKAGADVSKKAKEASRSIMSFDQLHTLTKENNEETSGTSSGSTESGGGASIASDFKAATKEASGLSKQFDGLVKKAKELANIFGKGFQAGLGKVDAKPILDNITTIGQKLKDIFTNQEVVNASQNFLEKWIYSAGQQVGAMASIGITIGKAVTGGLADYLSNNSGRITDFLVSMFDIGGHIAEITGNFSQAFAEVFSVFGDENGVQAVSNFIGIFADGFMGITEILGKFTDDLVTLFLQPFIDNTEGFKEAFNGLLGVAASVLGTLKDSVDATVGKALEVYDEHIHPLMQSLEEGVSKLVGTFLENWNEHIKPVLDRLAAKFDKVYKDHIQPMIDSFLELWGQFADTVKAFWENIAVPFGEWVMNTLGPVVGPIIEDVGNVALDIWGAVGDIVKAVEDDFRGILKFLEDVFKGDWDAAWTDIKKVFEDVFNGLVWFVAGPINSILTAVESLANGVVNGLNTCINAMNNLSFTVPDWVPGLGGSQFGFSIPTLPPISLPRVPVQVFAEGGFPEDGLFRANHGEVVGQFANGKTAVANNKQIEAGISVAVADAVVPIMLDMLSVMKSNNSEGQTITIDGEKVARIVTRYQNRISGNEYTFA